MKIREISFRDLYHKACYIEKNKSIESLMSYGEIAGAEQASGVLAYGYIDYEAGFSFEVLCFAKVNSEENIVLMPGFERTSLKLRRGSVSECEILIPEKLDLSGYISKIEMVNDGYT